MNGPSDEFREIGHSGGQVKFNVLTTDGRRSYQVGWQHSRPTPAALFAVYALPQGGEVVETIQLGGIGTPWNPPPVAGCYPVFIASDSEGFFGCQCPECQGYWRARSFPGICPYCGFKGRRHDFLTMAQRLYAKQYCEMLSEVLHNGADGEHIIDMDAVADAAGRDIPKPSFYYTEESQQNKYTCDACGDINDIIGRFGFCSLCGTRNDIQELTEKTIPKIRARINGGGPYDVCLREVASAFDSFMAQYMKELIRRVPMRARRRGRLEQLRSHQLDRAVQDIRIAFDIDLFSGLKQSEENAAKLMFHRRHVYEHNGGEADEKYITDSGDTTVRPKQALRETAQSVHGFANVVVTMAHNLHQGFHDIFPPVNRWVDIHTRHKAVMEVRTNAGRTPRPTNLARAHLSAGAREEK